MSRGNRKKIYIGSRIGYATLRQLPLTDLKSKNNPGKEVIPYLKGVGLC